jgi:hypothetical protein
MWNIAHILALIGRPCSIWNKKGQLTSLVCDSWQKERIKKAGKETQENNSHVAMLLFVFTISISNSKPMPQVQLTEWVSRANNGTHRPFPFALHAAGMGNGSVQPEV